MLLQIAFVTVVFKVCERNVMGVAISFNHKKALKHHKSHKTFQMSLSQEINSDDWLLSWQLNVETHVCAFSIHSLRYKIYHFCSPYS